MITLFTPFCTRTEMFFHVSREKISKAALFLLLTAAFAVGAQSANAQNDVEIRVYSGDQIDFAALDVAFDNVNGLDNQGNPITYNGSNGSNWRVTGSAFNPIPTDLSEWDGVDMVFVREGPNSTHTQAQVDVMVEFVRQGGILVGNFEEDHITSPRNGINPAYTGQYLANTFICSDVYIIHTFGEGDGMQGSPYPNTEHETCVEPFPYHPGEGNLNLTAPGWDNQVSNGGTDLSQAHSSWYVGVPSENAVLYCDADLGSVLESYGQNGENSTCSNVAVLDMVFPAFPGTPNECGIQGMAFISGESENGILENSDRENLQYNRNWAQLAYDFLYDPVAMADRNDWASSPANVNADCPATGGPGTPSGPAAGIIDCSKTQITSAPVAGVAGQKTLLVTVDVQTIGCFTGITVSGSGMSVANGITEVCTESTGIQTFAIPVYYDGSTLGDLTFTVGTAGTCSADLTQEPVNAISEIWTLECVPTVGPSLK